MSVDLIDSVPDDLVGGPSLDELLDALREIPDWTDRHADVLDYVYRQRTTRLLGGRHSEEELLALSEHLTRVVSAGRKDIIDRLRRRYGARWESFRDLLETRIAMLRGKNADAVIERAHVKPILIAICEAGRALPQAMLRERLGLGSANFTRILNLMEANDLIVRRAVGRENLIELGEEGERRRADLVPGGVPRPALRAIDGGLSRGSKRWTDELVPREPAPLLRRERVPDVEPLYAGE